MAQRKEEGGVKVVDRRVSSREDGTGADRQDAAAEPAAPAAPAGEEAEAERPARDATCDDPVPEVDFVTFALSLSTNGMVSLGILPVPGTTEKKLDLALARQTIDILAMLQEKTKGNLTGEEERILDNVLYDLRMTYVQVVREHC